MTLPWPSTGGHQVTVTEPLPPIACTFVGTPGVDAPAWPGVATGQPEDGSGAALEALLALYVRGIQARAGREPERAVIAAERTSLTRARELVVRACTPPEASAHGTPTRISTAAAAGATATTRCRLMFSSSLTKDDYQNLPIFSKGAAGNALAG